MTSSPTCKLWFDPKLIVFAAISMPGWVGLNWRTVLVLTKFDSKTQPVPLPPLIEISGLVAYPTPALSTLISWTDPLTLTCALHPVPWESTISNSGGLITS